MDSIQSMDLLRHGYHLSWHLPGTDLDYYDLLSIYLHQFLKNLMGRRSHQMMRSGHRGLPALQVLPVHQVFEHP